jgi:hypothetical protein
MSELDRNGVFSRDRHGRIYSRRMVRDAKTAKEAKKNGKLGGNPSLCPKKKKPPGVNPSHKSGLKPQGRRPIASKERDKSLQDLVSDAARPLGRATGVNLADAANRKAVWFSRMQTYCRAHLSRSDCEALLAGYANGEPWARKQMDELDAQRRTTHPHELQALRADLGLSEPR